MTGAGRFLLVCPFAKPIIGAAINAALKASEEENEDLRGVLPQKYSDEEYNTKCEAVYQHVYDSYYGAGRSVYQVAG